MKRIANNVALQTVGYVVSGLQKVNIYVKEEGYKKQDIFNGLYRDFCMNGMLTYSHCKVTEIAAKDDIICIGISMNK